jgi:hypothetical protein
MGKFPVRRVWTFGGHTHWMTVEKDGFKNVFIKIADFSSIYPIFQKTAFYAKQAPASLWKAYICIYSPLNPSGVGVRVHSMYSSGVVMPDSFEDDVEADVDYEEDEDE